MIVLPDVWFIWAPIRAFPVAVPFTESLSGVDSGV